MPLKIFLLNVHSDRNAGDLALSRVTVQQLQENFPGCQVTLSMNDPESYQGSLTALGSFFTWILAGSRWRRLPLLWLVPGTLLPILTWKWRKAPWFGLTPARWRSWLKHYLESDLVVSTAGGFFYSSGSGVTLLVTAYSLALAFLTGKPLYVFPQSFGPFRRGWERWLARQIYSRARVLMAREPISVQNLSSCGIPKEKIILLPDVALGFQGAPRQAALDWLQAHHLHPDCDRPLLGMTVIDWKAFNPAFQRQEIYEEAIIAAIRLFVQEYGGKVLLLPQTWGPTPPEDDRLPARRIASRLPNLSGSIFVIQDPLPPDLLQAVFGEMDLVIGTRMHSNIFSASRGVPVLPIGYLHKSLGIATMMGVGEWVVDIEKVEPPELTEKLAGLWKARQDVRRRLQEIIPTVIAESRKAGQIIAQDFRSLSVGEK